jgi:hypothetical protein
VSRTSYAKVLDQALRPLGFSRQGDDWIRVRGDMWECVNRQSSWLGGVTVNLLMKDLETEKLFLEIFAAKGAIQMPPTDTRIRRAHRQLRSLVEQGRARWSQEHGRGRDDVRIPWFDRVRTLEEQAANWYGRSTALSSRGYHSQSLIRLALTLFRMGELQEACDVLRKPVPKTAHPKWVEDVGRVRAWLGCEAKSEAQGSVT